MFDARMVGQHDVDLVTRLVSQTPEGTRFVELGPWLGFLTTILARRGPVEAIDTFVWTPDHAKRVPDFLIPGESFEGAYETRFASSPHPVKTHACDVSEFVWDGPNFQFCLIDAPKTANQLAIALARLLPCLDPNTCIVIINGCNLKYLSMNKLILNAIQKGILSWDQNTPASGSKAAVLRLGTIEGISDLEGALNEMANEQLPIQKLAGTVDAMRPVEVVSAIFGSCEKGRWSDAYELLAQLEGNTELRSAWGTVEARLDFDGFDVERLGYLSHLAAEIFEDMQSGHMRHPIHKDPLHAIEEFWFRNADKQWRASAFHPEIIHKAQETGYLDWPSEIDWRLEGKRVLDIGCGSGLHGIGVLAAGAASYHGIDPELRIRSDKVKDLRSKKKIRFGWSGRDLIERFTPFTLSAESIETFEPKELFDVALMHMVTQHLPDIDLAIDSVADALAPGGKLIVRHRNFNAWSGHQLAPKTVSEIDPKDPDSMNLVDWRHIDFDAPPDHYISRKLNRVSLGSLRKSIERRFTITEWVATASTEAQGLGRLTNEVRSRHPELNDDDFETQSVFLVADLSPS